MTNEYNLLQRKSKFIQNKILKQINFRALILCNIFKKIKEIFSYTKQFIIVYIQNSLRNILI